jgi:hypothetical protein
VDVGRPELAVGHAAKSFLPMFSTAVTSPWTAAISFFTPSTIWSTVSCLPRLSRMKVAR